MLHLAKDLWTDQSGFVVSAELVLISTVGVIGIGTGLVCLRDAVNSELSEVGCAITALDQSYCYTGFHGYKDPCSLRIKAQTAGSSYSPHRGPESEDVDMDRDHDPAHEERLHPTPEPEHDPRPHFRDREDERHDERHDRGDDERDDRKDSEKQSTQDRVIRKPLRTRDSDSEDSDTPARRSPQLPPKQPQLAPLHVPSPDRPKDR